MNTQAKSSTFSKFEKWIDENVSPMAGRFGSERHVVAIREAFLSVIAFIVIGAFFMLLTSVPGVSTLTKPIASQLTVAQNLTFGLVAVYLSFSLAYNLAIQYNYDGLTGGLLGLMAFFFAVCPQITDSLPLTYLGEAGIFVGMIASIYAVEVYRLCMQHGIYIKAPEAVPPAVVRFFEMLVPEIVVILPIWLLSSVFSFAIAPWIVGVFSHLALLVDTLAGALVMDGVLNNWTWFLGIHPWSILGPLYLPFLTQNSLANAAAAAAGQPMHFVQTLSWYAGSTTGGTGSTISLAIFCLISKSKRLRALGAVSIIPVLCHVNEPLLFGLPIILNPIWLIPFCILQPLVMIVPAFLAVKAGFVAYASVPFFGFVPGPINWFLGTLDWRAIPWAFLTGWILPGLVYYPFWRVFERGVLREESKQAAEAEAENPVLQSAT
jgi:PTS system cellobiose-specific IIC component